MSKKRILLKVTGRIFCDPTTGFLSTALLDALLGDIAFLQYEQQTYQFGVVIGGGNLFRGSTGCTQIGVTESAAHEIGMLATVMNGLIIADRARSLSIPHRHFSGISIPFCGATDPSVESIKSALSKNELLLFSGGTGAPFVTTDTAAVIRALQMDATEIWKGTDVSGVYNADPKKNSDAYKFDQITYQYLLERGIDVMDQGAYALCQKYKRMIRVFSLLDQGALLQAAVDESFGTKISF